MARNKDEQISSEGFRDKERQFQVVNKVTVCTAKLRTVQTFDVHINISTYESEMW